MEKYVYLVKAHIGKLCTLYKLINTNRITSLTKLLTVISKAVKMWINQNMTCYSCSAQRLLAHAISA